MGHDRSTDPPACFALLRDVDGGNRVADAPARVPSMVRATPRDLRAPKGFLGSLKLKRDVCSKHTACALSASPRQPCRAARASAGDGTHARQLAGSCGLRRQPRRAPLRCSLRRAPARGARRSGAPAARGRPLRAVGAVAPALAAAGRERRVHDQAQQLAGGGGVEERGAPGRRAVQEQAHAGHAQDARQRARRVGQAQQRARVHRRQVLARAGGCGRPGQRAVGAFGIRLPGEAARRCWPALAQLALVLLSLMQWCHNVKG
jgi:hypothetical protein